MKEAIKQLSAISMLLGGLYGNALLAAEQSGSPEVWWDEVRETHDLISIINGQTPADDNSVPEEVELETVILRELIDLGDTNEPNAAHINRSESVELINLPDQQQTHPPTVSITKIDRQPSRIETLTVEGDDDVQRSQQADIGYGKTGDNEDYAVDEDYGDVGDDEDFGDDSDDGDFGDDGDDGDFGDDGDDGDFGDDGDDGDFGDDGDDGDFGDDGR